MISLTSLTATSSFDRLVAQNRAVCFTALSWVASSVVVATLLGGAAAAFA
jgi:hypothetical protein